MKKIFLIFTAAVVFFSCEKAGKPIDRKALIDRNCPQVEGFDSLASLSAGNGDFCFTVDATGLQTFPERYRNGVPLGTQSSWGWHSFPNPQKYRFEETLKEYDFGHDGRKELYAVQHDAGRPNAAADWYRANPHRLHLGYVGFELDSSRFKVQGSKSRLDLWTGMIYSRFDYEGDSVTVKTAVSSEKDMIAAEIKTGLFQKGKLAVNLRFPYPTGNHTDDATDFSAPEKHKTEVILHAENQLVLKRTIDSTRYFVVFRTEQPFIWEEKQAHYFVLIPENENFTFTVEFTEHPDLIETTLAAPNEEKVENPAQVFAASTDYWQKFWTEGAAVDFSECTDPRAKELERRVVLSQYLLAINSAGMYPPQETGLTYNSWFGKFHLEMIWWHEAQFALWNRPKLLERTMDWYEKAAPIAREIAERQGFKGIRWMKMTDPGGLEAPSGVGSFLIWQQPHYIYLAELLYRDTPTDSTLDRYYRLVQETAEFMYDFADYEADKDRFVLKGIIPAQETLPAAETVNPPFELSYWHLGLLLAQQWRERKGEKRNAEWDI
ncbi:MAG: hypothetical protein LBE91_16630, partial [Tannerella sp.]|nr:hypothetical protein [Tannerella sp.]